MYKYHNNDFKLQKSLKETQKSQKGYFERAKLEKTKTDNGQTSKVSGQVLFFKLISGSIKEPFIMLR